MLSPQLVSSCRAKIARADEHLDALDRETNGWGDGDPFRIVRESNADGSEHLFRLQFKVQPDVWRWALLLGDALNNLRSALDHIVYALAIQQTGSDPPPDSGRLMFPICSDEEHFKDRRLQKRIRCLDEPTRAAIEKAQPYNRLKPGKWFMPLWWLSGLNDIDKHRLPHLSPVAMRADTLTVHDQPGTFTARWNDGHLVDGAPLLWLTLTKPDPYVKVDLHAVGAVVLKLKDIKPFGVHAVTQHIRHEVVLICRYLSRFG